MNTVVYHSADFDGIFCREIAKKFMPDAELIGWNFGDPELPFPDEGRVYVLDLSPDCLPFLPGVYALAEQLDRIVWIDHHKTSIDKWQKDIPGYRIDGVAACRLAWQWFSNGRGFKQHLPAGTWNWPTREEYINRTVNEPLAVRLAGEHDVWDKRDPRAEVFQFGLRAKDLTSDDWKWLLTVSDSSKQGEYDLAMTNEAVDGLVRTGKTLQRYQLKIDADLVTYKSFRLKWEGLDWLCLNTGRFNSLTFSALDAPGTGHDALLGFMWNGKVWTVSLYHANHRTDLDLSAIAIKHGGGGHKGACGFTCSKLPFL